LRKLVDGGSKRRYAVALESTDSAAQGSCTTDETDQVVTMLGDVDIDSTDAGGTLRKEARRSKPQKAGRRSNPKSRRNSQPAKPSIPCVGISRKWVPFRFSRERMR